MVCQEKTERAGQSGRGSRGRKQAEAVAEPEAGTDTARSLVATGDTHTHGCTHTHREAHTHREVYTHWEAHSIGLCLFRQAQKTL